MTKSKRFSLLLCLALAGSALGAGKVQIRLGAARESEVWVLVEAPKKVPVGGQKFSMAAIPLAIPDGMEKGTVVLLDSKTGNVAIRPVSGFEANIWQVKPEEWKIGELRVEAFSRGNPMPAGTVEVETGAFSQESPIENGKASFFAVPPGDVKCTVHYVSAGAKKSSSQTFRAELKRDDAVPSFAITVKDPVEGMVASKASPREGSPIVNAIIWLVGLGAAVAAGWYAYQLLRKHEGKVEEALKKAGVQIPGQPQEPEPAGAEPFTAPPLVPEGHCQYCGQPFAADGSCACQVGATPSVPTAHSGRVRLVGPVELAIEEGGHVIGREAELLISDASISRRHAEIKRDGNAVAITDLGSSNGTFVNGSKIDTETELKPGDTVQFGLVKFRFEG